MSLQTYKLTTPTASTTLSQRQAAKWLLDIGASPAQYQAWQNLKPGEYLAIDERKLERIE